MGMTEMLGRFRNGVAVITLLSSIVLCAALFVLCQSARAQEQFTTPEDAVSTLVQAAKSQDQKSLLTVLGPDGKAIVSSGDPVADANARTILCPHMTPNTHWIRRGTAAKHSSSA